MKSNTSILFTSLCCFILLASCNNNDTAEKKIESKKENCLFAYNNSASVLEWTAFKYESKKGVNGTFKEINVTSEKEAVNEKELLLSLSFSIPISSVETNNTERNGKIIKYFFGTLNKTEKLEGKIISIDSDSLTMSINMNGISQDVKAGFTMINGALTLNTVIDVMNWNAETGIKALNMICEELHREKPGQKSMLWSEVELSFTTKFSKTCN